MFDEIGTLLLVERLDDRPERICDDLCIVLRVLGLKRALDPGNNFSIKAVSRFACSGVELFLKGNWQANVEAEGVEAWHFDFMAETHLRRNGPTSAGFARKWYYHRPPVRM